MQTKLFFAFPTDASFALTSRPWRWLYWRFEVSVNSVCFTSVLCSTSGCLSQTSPRIYGQRERGGSRRTSDCLRRRDLESRQPAPERVRTRLRLALPVPAVMSHHCRRPVVRLLAGKKERICNCCLLPHALHPLSQACTTCGPHVARESFSCRPQELSQL